MNGVEAAHGSLNPKERPLNEHPAVTFGLTVLKVLYVTGTLLYIWIQGIVKALLPTGVLPRKSVKDQIVLITGAGSGLGRLMAEQFAQLGAQLVLWDVNQSGNEQTVKLCKSAGATKVHAYTVDLSNRENVEKLAETVKTEVGTVDILINNAGIVTGRPLLECSDKMIEKTFEVNAISHFWTTKAFIEPMLTRNHGHIVSIASCAGLFGTAKQTDYCASKFAAVGFSESLTVELHVAQKTGVHVTTVCPMYIDTGMFQGADFNSPFFPMLKPEYVVERTMDAILTNTRMLLLPRTAYLMYYLKGILPIDLTLFIGDLLGATTSMAHFKGREDTKN